MHASETSTPPLNALKADLAELLEARKRRLERTALTRYRPYAKQKEFHCAAYRERLLMAGNQLGKSYSGGAEMAMHLTGDYPDWWEGLRFDKPIRAWAASVTAEVTRDGVQRILLGEPSDSGAIGTGMIPGDSIIETKRRANVPNAIASVVVKHKSGGNSSLVFKSYDQGREKFQADTLDLIWLDEEPPAEIYYESLTRTNATGGKVYMTFTPLKGMSDIVMRFLQEESDDMNVTRMTIEDAEHISEEERARIIAGYPAHEREARVKGIPALGSGRVFPIAEEEVRYTSTPEMEARLDTLPAIGGIDFGWDHPTACVELRHDRDADIVYVRRTHRQREATPVLIAAAVKPWGDWIPFAWPHDGLQHDKGSGERLADLYAAQGLTMCDERATFEDGGHGVEAGLMEMLDRMQTGRFKVAEHLEDWWQEFRLYHRKDGVVVKERDDLMAATRYGVMMLREAVTAPRPFKPVNRIRRVS